MKHLSLMLALVASLVLAGCQLLPSASLPDDPGLSRITDPKARRFLQQGQVLEAADVYSRKAERETDPATAQDYRLIAAELLFDRGLNDEGEKRLAEVPAGLASLELRQRRGILDARAALHAGEPEQALAELPDPGLIRSNLHRARVLETRALAYRLLDDPTNELTARIDLERYLNNPDVIDRNHDEIWAMLARLPVARLREMTINVRNDTYQGWIELALGQVNGGKASVRQVDTLARWREQFPEHPAGERFVDRLFGTGSFAGLSSEGEAIEQIGVLLPLSDRATASAAEAIRDGMIGAWERARAAGPVPDLRFYDVGEDPAYARTAWRDALAAGANAIVGPLRKQAVAAVVTQRDIPVPTITLNTVARPAGADALVNIIQFGLAPEDEARAAANRAIALGLDQAIVLQSDDSRGDREARAFQEAMFALGGDVAYTAVLPDDNYDFSRQIRDALQITQSDERFRAVSRTIGERLFFEPAIRDDVNVVFMAVNSEQARSVRPQLAFFRAARIPKLGTSRIASVVKDEKLNADLNGIAYPDAPWVLRDSMRDDPLKLALEAHFEGASQAYAKLYALGIDAFSLISNLAPLAAGKRLPGYTGGLELGADGRITRQLDWAEYRNGQSMTIDTVEAPALPAIGSVAN